MSAVYKANDPNLDRVVAVKLIHPHLSDNSEFVVRFKEEATSVAQLRHPNIVQVFDFNNDGDTFYMVLEFVPGETLQARLQRLNATQRHLSVTEATKFAAQICDAAEYAHQRGMVHRDIKPANVMLDINGQAILMDFGIAKILGGQSHTATGATVGTALYMSPEQIRGVQVDARSDVYSIGVTLFEMVSGRPPYEADSAMTLLMMHLNDPVPDLRQLRPQTPPGLAAVIEKALAKDRDARFQSAAAMAAALRDIGAPAAAAPVRQSQPEAEPLAATVAETPPPGTGRGLKPAAPVSQVQPLEEGPASASRAGVGQREGRSSGVLSGLPLSPALLAGGGVGVVLLLIIAFVLGGAFSRGGDEGESLAQAFTSTPTPAAVEDTSTTEAESEDATGTAQALVAAPSATLTPTNTPEPTATDEPTNTPVSPTATNTATPRPTATTAPTATEAPPTATSAPIYTFTPTPMPTNTPLPDPYARINGITVQGNDYVVDYTTIGFTESQEQWHTHFFFNTVYPEQAGVPGAGPWIVYYGPNPFTLYKVSDRPAGATQMCVRVANADHSLYKTASGSVDTGNCANLP
jgi:hypothetical protein